MARFDPPDSHWAADFDQRLASSLTWLKERIEGEQDSVAVLAQELRALVAEAQQCVADARYWAEQSRRGQ